MNISKWPVKWLKAMVVFFGFMLLINFFALLSTEEKGDRLFRFIMVIVGAAVFGYTLLGLKIGMDREEKRMQGKEDDED